MSPSELRRLSTARGPASILRHRNPLALAWIISQVLLCAPRSLLAGILRLRSRHTASDEDLARAAAIFDELGERPGWAPLADLLADDLSIRLLTDLRLLWVRRTDGVGEVKVATPIRRRYFPRQSDTPSDS